MTYLQIIDYFETLARAHKTVLHTDHARHFFRDFAEFEQMQRQQAYTPAIVCGPPDDEINGANRDATTCLQNFSMVILERVKEDSRDARLQGYDTCRSIALDFVARMQYDVTCRAKAAGSILKFNPDTVKIEPVGPVSSNYYGVSIDLSFVSLEDLTYNATKWDG